MDRDDVAPSLRRLGDRGFVERICVDLSISDFEDEEPSSDEGCLSLDRNDPPFVQFIPSVEEFSSGIVPIRFRLFDSDNAVREQRSAGFRVGFHGVKLGPQERSKRAQVGAEVGADLQDARRRLG